MAETPYLPALLALSSAFLFALSIQVQNMGLGHADPRSGALVNIGTTAAVYWLLSPFFIESSYWLTTAAGLFAIVGLFRPALSANMAMASVKMLGPSLTSGLAATAPVFAAFMGVAILGETMTWPLAIGTGAVVAGVAVTAVRPGGLSRGWPLWAIGLPFGAAFFRALGHPITMIGFQELPEPFFAGMVSYSVSFVVALIAFKVQRRTFATMSWGYGWFAFAGLLNGLSLYSLNTALKLGQVVTVVPIVACSPVFTIAMSLLIFKKETITWQTLATIALVVSGVVMVVVQG